MKIIVAAPGRAGGALALAAERAGHEIAGLVSRSPSSLPPSLLHLARLDYEVELPPADLLMVASRDAVIAEVARRLAPAAAAVGAAVHLSGFTSVAALASLQEAGHQTGSFHPLQTLPSPDLGAEALAGSWVGITAAEPLAGKLRELARSLGMIPFVLADAHKPAYHAAAAASSNFVLAALGTAEKLLAAAAVPREAARPLTEAVVANAYAIGARQALTGPISRGDWATVAGQLAAAQAEGVGNEYRLLAEATARLAGLAGLPEGI